MKKTTFIILIVCLSAKTFAQNQFTFSGKITGEPNAWVMLGYLNSDGKRITDSCSLKSEAFSFKGNINEPTRADLYLSKPYYKNSVNIFLEPGSMMANGSYEFLNKLKITGSKTQGEYESLQLQLDQINGEFVPIAANINIAKKEYNRAKQNNRPPKELDSLSEKVDALSKLREPLAEKYETIVHQFVITRPNSFISPIQMITYAGSWQLDSVKNIYNRFSPAVQSSFNGKAILKVIEAREKIIAETSAKNFSATDVKGKAH
jgi:hypothetical protein